MTEIIILFGLVAGIMYKQAYKPVFKCTMHDWSNEVTSGVMVCMTCNKRSQ